MKKDLLTLFSDSLSAAQSSGELFFDDAKNNFLSSLEGIMKSLFVSLLSFILITMSSLYLLIFATGRVFDYLNWDLTYRGPFYAGMTLLLCLGYILYTSNQKRILRKRERRQDLKKIANFRKEMSELAKAGKSIVENPIQYAKEKSLQFYSSSPNLKILSKYKTLFTIAFVVTVIIVIKYFFTKSRAVVAANDKIEKKLVSKDQNPIWELLEGFFIAIGASILKEVITEFLSKPSKPLAEVKYQQT